MPIEHSFKVLLNLDEGWEVKSVETDIHKGEININIECLLQTFEKEGQLCEFYDLAPKRHWRHLDTLQYKTTITCRLPRAKSPTGKIITIDPPWASSHQRYTTLFERWTIDLLKATKNQTKTAELLDCGFNVINRIMHASTSRGLERRRVADHQYAHLSLDEKAFKKGHHYVSVLSDPDTGCVLEIEDGRDKKASQSLLNKALTAEQRDFVKTISLDMWKAYLSSSRELLPQAEVIHDRFHLVKYLNDAIDKVRRREVKKYEELKDSRYALLKNKENLTERQRIKFESICGANYAVSHAWQVRENFKALFGSMPEEGMGLFICWAKDALRKGIKEVNRVIKMFMEHIRGVVASLTMRFSNAMAERLNGKIQEVKTIGRGYRTFANFRSAILFFHGGLQLYPH